MKRVLLSLSFLCLFAASVSADEFVNIKIVTNQGDITLALNETKAPKTVANMLQYIDEGFYKNTVFHRVIKDFMIQGGGYDTDYKRKTPHAPIKNEADNGLKNERGSIAMARTSDPHSATAQFFINHTNNSFLNYTSSTTRGWGYTVFGKVTDGMDTVDKIAAIPTGSRAPFSQDVPRTPVIIEDIQRLK